jgi:hypothetical protein
MRTILQSLLAILTLGMVSVGCNRQQPQQEAPATATDVTLLVPGMN